jgi:hypothetical protein
VLLFKVCENFVESVVLLEVLRMVNGPPKV